MSERDSILAELEEVAIDLGMTLEAVLREKCRELQLRRFIDCVPNWRIKESDLQDFVQRVIKRPAPPELVNSITLRRRGPSLEPVELISLEERQFGRCAVCGIYLNRLAAPHVDHIVPVVFGGASVLTNYQLLCAKCNLGKGSAIHWLMGNPFFAPVRKEISARLRYCVLASANGRCSQQGCEASTQTSELKPSFVVSPGAGGRRIFDNLIVLCLEHAREREEQETERAFRKMRAAAGRYRLALRFPRMSG